jgi:hypothetical protein
MRYAEDHNAELREAAIAERERRKLPSCATTGTLLLRCSSLNAAARF